MHHCPVTENFVWLIACFLHYPSLHCHGGLGLRLDGELCQGLCKDGRPCGVEIQRQDGPPTQGMDAIEADRSVLGGHRLFAHNADT